MNEVYKIVADAGTVSGGLKSPALLNKWTCPAKFQNAWVDDAVTDKAIVETTTPWWCSDGTYNMVANADYGTLGSNSGSYGATKGSYATTPYAPVIVLTVDRRVELFYASCRQ